MSHMKDEYGDWRKVSYVAADGPRSAGVNEMSGIEFPEWVVAVVDAEDEDIKVYCVGSYEKSQSLGQKIADDRKVEFVNDAGYA